MSDKERILAWLKERPITPREAYNELGCYRLGARIYDLRCMGHNIETEMVDDIDRHGDPCRYARYHLRKEK